jgi:hypothetical protein
MTKDNNINDNIQYYLLPFLVNFLCYQISYYSFLFSFFMKM